MDNYKQDHAQLHWNESWGNQWSSHLALHFTRGRGYFEQFREDDDFGTYGFLPVNINGEFVNTTDLVRRRWLDNDFYGTVFSLTKNTEVYDFVIGGGYNIYKGDHFGEVIWARNAPDSFIRDRYYEDDSRKSDFNIFAKTNYALNENLRLFADMQFRTVGYEANGAETGLVDDTFNFFNPKAGLTYSLNQNNRLYFSYAVAQREPNRNDYENGNPRPEKLNDFELGWRYLNPDFQINANVYYMRYKDQLVLTGELNDVGAPLRANVGDSYRLGLEIEANLKLGRQFNLQPNIALSSNKNLDFVFQRDGSLQDLGNTNIAFSPGVVIGNRLLWTPSSAWEVSLLSKYVGEQYMGNIDSENSILEVNNVFDAKFVSNGYFFTYDDDFSNPGTITTIEGAGFYPQAGINFLLGATVSF